ncbi:MAG TPA: SGNH/GDSL hydrolase family protein [Chondromyces sp.]|nr:SGNH/GDSL hydrolase family protein [Chondromyces sp.]
MKKQLLLFIMLTIGMTGCSGNILSEYAMKSDETSTKNVEEEIIPQDLRVVSIGDSLTQGVGDSTNQGGYVPYLRERLENIKSVDEALFSNFGIKGNRTDQLLNRLQTEEVHNEIKQADLVIITIGGNDVMKVFRDNLSELQIDVFEKERSLYEERLNKIITEVRKKNPQAGIVLVGLYNPFFKWFADIKEVDHIVDQWNQSSKQIISQYPRTQFVEIADIFKDVEEHLLYEDHFHPNNQGYQLIADRLFDSINGEKLEELTNEKLVYSEEE